MKSRLTLHMLAVGLVLVSSSGAAQIRADDMGDLEQTAIENINKSVNTMPIDSINLANPFVIDAEKVSELTRSTGWGVEQLLRKLVPIAQRYARPSISNYPVGAVALGKSGAIYLGANLEFPGVPLNAAVHAEQFVIALARSYGETEMIAMALSAAPCGHCRQFMYEMGDTTEFQLLIKGAPAQLLSTLLPAAFGPQDLAILEGILTPPKGDYAVTLDYSLRSLALQALFSSFAPYSLAKSGVAIQTKEGRIYNGAYLETAAFNPSLSPLQVALVALVADQCDYADISAVLLIEQENAKISHEVASREILRNIAPQATFMAKKQVF